MSGFEDNSRNHTYAQPLTLRNRWKVIWTKASLRGGDNCCKLRGGTHPLRCTSGEVARHQGWRPPSMSSHKLWLRKRAQESSEDAANSRETRTKSVKRVGTLEAECIVQTMTYINNNRNGTLRNTQTTGNYNIHHARKSRLPLL